MINSKRKGARGERSFRDLLVGAGFVARRSQQYCGTEDSADIISPELPFYWEVKFGATHSLDAAFRQAKEQSGPRTPVVASRRDRGEWMVYLRASDFLKIVQLWAQASWPLPINEQTILENAKDDDVGSSRAS